MVYIMVMAGDHHCNYFSSFSPLCGSWPIACEFHGTWFIFENEV